MKYAENVIELIGNTPLVKLNQLTKHTKANVFIKLESANPGGSVKDRLALALINDAEKRGVLKPGGTIVEPTSGNTGIGLAMVCAVRNYQLIVTMPETASIERRKIIAGFGAKIVLTKAEEGMKGAIRRAEKICSDVHGAYMPMQFENPANIAFHQKTSALEIWRDCDGLVDAFVAGVGTGGTFSGVSSVLKEKNAGIKTFAVEPAGSPVLSGGKPGSHKIQGIGAGFIPANCKTELIDEVIQVENDEAFVMAQRLMKEEGILCGISSGANVWAAVKLAEREEFIGKNIIVIVCDTGERYLSTTLFE